MGGRFGLFDACGLARRPRVAANDIGAAGAKDLAEALKVNTSLTDLNLMGARATALPPPCFSPRIIRPHAHTGRLSC